MITNCVWPTVFAQCADCVFCKLAVIAEYTDMRKTERVGKCLPLEVAPRKGTFGVCVLCEVIFR